MKRVLKLLISLCVYLADELRATTASVLGKSDGRTCAVLYYHEVVESDRQRFAAQLDVIRREATPVSALAFPGVRNGKKCVAITVDDAFISFFKHGLPELEQRNIPVVVFVPTAWLGRTVDWAMEEVMSSPNERIATLAELKEYIRHPLVRIGSHTANHRKLSGLNDAEALRELSESKEFLEHELGAAVDAVSFPYGGFTGRDVKLASDLGYKTFFTTQPEILTEESNNGIVGRFRVEPSDWRLEVRLKTAGAYRWEACLRRIRSRSAWAGAGASAAASA